MSKFNISSSGLFFSPLVPKNNTINRINCYIDLGLSAEDYWNFFGDWRYLFRLLNILNNQHINIFLPDEVVSAVKLSSYSQCLSCYKIHSSKTQSSLKNTSMLVHILPFSQRQLKSQDDIKLEKIKNVYIHLDGSVRMADLSHFRGNVVRVPFGAHPKIAALNSYKHQRRKLQNIDRRNIRILNSCSRGDIYNDEIILDSSLQVISGRNRLLSFLYQELKNENHIVLNSPNLFWDYFSRAFSRTKIKLISLDQNRLFSEWLFTLALSDTYLCLPGRCLITCHNVYEAMSVGTIPILQYGKWFNPPLEDGINCFSFQDEHDLAFVIRRVLNTSQDKIEWMRKNVTDYFESNLSEKSLGEKIFNTSDDVLLLLDSEWNTEKIKSESIIFQR